MSVQHRIWIQRLTWIYPFVFLFLFSCGGHVTSISGIPIEETSDQPAWAGTDSFRLGVGDTVIVKVYRNDDLERTLKIDPTGMVNFPLVGNIQAAGLTPAQFSENLQVRLTEFLVDPMVDINAITLNSQKAYVMGEVKTQGVVTLDRPYQIWEAIAQSGGFTTDANQNGVMLIREKEGKINVSVYNMNIFDQMRKGSFSPGLYLQNKDIVFVPPSVISNIERFARRLSAIIAPILSIEQAIILGPDVEEALRGNTTDKGIVIGP